MALDSSRPASYISGVRTFIVIVLAVAACSRTSSTADQGNKPVGGVTATADKLGTPITAGAPVVALADVMQNPSAYKGKAFVTTGTVTAVCQQMGCWMEIKDATSEAHIKMAGEKFFVPKTSAGHQARVQGTLVDVAGADSDCAQEAASQTSKQVAKIQLEATGVELD
jgi:hypothetical protein